MNYNLSLIIGEQLKISLLLGENTSLTLSQIPHNFVGLFSLSHSSLALSFVLCKMSLDALPIYRQASKQWARQGAYIYWLRWKRWLHLLLPPLLTYVKDGFTFSISHRLVSILVAGQSWWLASHSPTWRLWWVNQVFTHDHLWFFYPFNTCHLGWDLYTAICVRILACKPDKIKGKG